MSLCQFNIDKEVANVNHLSVKVVFSHYAWGNVFHHPSHDMQAQQQAFDFGRLLLQQFYGHATARDVLDVSHISSLSIRHISILCINILLTFSAIFVLFHTQNLRVSPNKYFLILPKFYTCETHHFICTQI